MSRLLKFVAFAVAALSVVALLPQTASAVEGLGAHKGSLIFFPFWNNNGANRTYFRIGMSNEINDTIPWGQIQLHIFYLVRNPNAVWTTQQIPACLEFDRMLPFTENDWELVNVFNHNNGMSFTMDKTWDAVGSKAWYEGWAFAYAVLFAPNQPRVKIAWDRFFSDTFVLDTTLGTLVSWNNYQEWANTWTANNLNVLVPGTTTAPYNGGLCPYYRDTEYDNLGAALGANPICTVGFDNGNATMSASPNLPPIAAPIWDNDYFGADFPQTFYVNYFANNKALKNGTYSQTMISTTPVHVDDLVCPDPFNIGGCPFVGYPQRAHFGIAVNVQQLQYQFAAQVWDDREVMFSGPPQYVICHEYAPLGWYVSNTAMGGNRMGYAYIYELDYNFGGPIMTPIASEDAVMISIDQLNNFTGMSGGVPTGPFNGATAVFPTHNRTTFPMSYSDVIWYAWWWALPVPALAPGPSPVLKDTDANVPHDGVNWFPPGVLASNF